LNPTILELLLVSASAVAAFFISQGARRGKTKTAAAASILVPVILVLADRVAWANSGKGLLDHLTCVVAPLSPSCARVPEHSLTAPPVAGALAPQANDSRSADTGPPGNASSAVDPPIDPLRSIDGTWAIEAPSLAHDPCGDGAEIFHVSGAELVSLSPIDYVNGHPRRSTVAHPILGVGGGDLFVQTPGEVIVFHDRDHFTWYGPPSPNRSIVNYRRCPSIRPHVPALGAFLRPLPSASGRVE
jgi:hypothetical protein